MIKVGDRVTWRPGKSESEGFAPMGIAHCEVLYLGKSMDGRAAAQIETGIFGVQNAYVDDLELEDGDEGHTDRGDHESLQDRQAVSDRGSAE